GRTTSLHRAPLHLDKSAVGLTQLLFEHTDLGACFLDFRSFLLNLLGFLLGGFRLIGILLGFFRPFLRSSGLGTVAHRHAKVFSPSSPPFLPLTPRFLHRPAKLLVHRTAFLEALSHLVM